MNTFKCLNCGKEKQKNFPNKKQGQTYNNINKYCNHQCQLDFQYNERVKNFLNGEYIGKPLSFYAKSKQKHPHWARRMMIEKKGYKCNSCGISEWQGQGITLDVNHIDGQAYNNILENLEFLCPNCHSQTSTYGNKGGRKSDRSYRRKTE
jgi:5-methylcytosine-specific restriction endonuclease McrA|tara:strand:- start:2451 stop:2900 length:450 start_codon:yes stop_codon:yes gene_type:complete